MRIRREFEAYAPLVRIGSYVVIEHTAMNGFPIDASAGPGPHEALRRIMNVHGEFLADSEREKHGLTFNGGGFLRRICDICQPALLRRPHAEDGGDGPARPPARHLPRRRRSTRTPATVPTPGWR